MIIHKCYENGKSLKIVIPHAYARALNLKAHSHVLFELLPDKIITMKALAISATKHVGLSKKGKAS